MRKIFLVVMICTVISLLFGCSKPTEETKTLDYEQMDKEFNQHKDKIKNDKGNGITQFAEDMPYIESCIGEYADCLISGDANRYAREFPNDYITAIMTQEGCTWDTAVDIASTKIWETFNSVENKYIEVRELNLKYGHKVVVKDVARFSRETALINIYGGLGINLTDAVEVSFEISSLGKSADGYMRLVKTEKGDWEPDMSYFKI